jgi:hypothetical protein
MRRGRARGANPLGIVGLLWLVFVAFDPKQRINHAKPGRVTAVTNRCCRSAAALRR